MTRKRTEAPAVDAWHGRYLYCSASRCRKSTGKEENQTYLKEGNIGKAESEEVVPVKTEHITSHSDFVGRTLEGNRPRPLQNFRVSQTQTGRLSSHQIVTEGVGQDGCKETRRSN